MALGQGNLINYGNPVETVSDAMRTTSVQTALQQRTDVNKLKIEELVKSVTSIPLIRDKDKEYLYNKLNGLIQTANNSLKTSGGKGLMSNAITTEIEKYISTAVDDNILNQLANSKKIMTFEKGVADLKNKKPETYNNINYAYAKQKARYNKYISGEIDTIGSLEYNPYVDYKQTIMEKVIKLKQLKGDQTIEVPDGRGGKTVTKISGLTPQEIIEYFPSMISSQEEKQMAIDGWASLSNASPEQIKSVADDFFSTRKEVLNNKISELEAIEQTGTQYQKEEARRTKNAYLQDLESLTQKENQIDKTNPEQIGYMLNKADFLNTASNLFSGKTSVSYEKDETFFAKLKLEQDLEEKTQKEEKERQQKLRDNQIYVSPIKNQEVEPADFYKDVRQNFNTAYNTVIGTSEQAYNDLRTPDEIKTRYEATLRENNYEIRNGKIVSTIPNNKASKAAVAELAFNESGMNNLPFGYDKRISEAGTIRSFLSNALVKAENTFKEELPLKQLVKDLDPLLRTYGADVLAGTDQEDNDINRLSNKYKKYLQSIGGVQNLKEVDKGALLSIALEFNNIRKINDSSSPILESVNIADKAGEKLKTLGVDPFVKSKWTATIGGESLMNDIVKSIPAQDMQGSALFNPKEGNFTIRKLNENEIEITQAQGIKLDKDKNSIGIAPARTVVVRGSDTFNLISQNIDVENKFTLDAQNTPSGFKIKPNIKPQFYNLDSELDFIQNLEGRWLTNVGENVRQSIQSKIGGYDVVKYFSSDEGTRHFLKAYLGNSVSEQQVDSLVDRISSNFDKYNIEYINNNKSNWMVRFSTPSGLEVMGNLSDNPELDSDYTYVLKNMPQLLIMTEIANYLKKSPSKIDSL